jgi:hypothetical protein
MKLHFGITLNPQVIFIYFLMLRILLFMVQDLELRRPTPSGAYLLKITNYELKIKGCELICNSIKKT